jgi:hypothetical protein
MYRHTIDLLALGAFALVHVACGPYVISYKHVCFKETNGLQVLKRSTSSDSHERPLIFVKSGLPVQARVLRDSYTVLIDTPVNAIPVVFLTARTPTGAALMLEGAHFLQLELGSGAYIEGYRYSFLVKEAKGQPLRFAVRDMTGKIVGVETLPYAVRSRGVTFGIDSV